MSCCPPAPDLNEQGTEGAGMRIIGLDIHRAFAEAVAWDDGKLRRLGRVDMRRDLLRLCSKLVEGGHGRRRGDRQRSVGRGGDRARM